MFKTDFNAGGVADRYEAAKRRAQMVLDAMVLQDSNYYCPQETGKLQQSAILSTEIGSGHVMWDTSAGTGTGTYRTPYAAKQYYGDRLDHSKGRNPNAMPRWFEVAKSRRGDEWIAGVKEAFRHG